MTLKEMLDDSTFTSSELDDVQQMFEKFSKKEGVHVGLLESLTQLMEVCEVHYHSAQILREHLSEAAMNQEPPVSTLMYLTRAATKKTLLVSMLKRCTQ